MERSYSTKECKRKGVDAANATEFDILNLIQQRTLLFIMEQNGK